MYVRDELYYESLVKLQIVFIYAVFKFVSTNINAHNYKTILT